MSTERLDEVCLALVEAVFLDLTSPAQATDCLKWRDGWRYPTEEGETGNALRLALLVLGDKVEQHPTLEGWMRLRSREIPE